MPAVTPALSAGCCCSEEPKAAAPPVRPEAGTCCCAEPAGAFAPAPPAAGSCCGSSVPAPAPSAPSPCCCGEKGTAVPSPAPGCCSCGEEVVAAPEPEDRGCCCGGPAGTGLVAATFRIEGLGCACEGQIIEKRVKSLKGVTDFSLNPLTYRMKLVYDPAKVSVSDIESEVKQAGMSAILVTTKKI